MPENLKPRLQYKAMLADMSFSLSNYMINVDKRLSPFKMNVRNKTGDNEAKLRHEIEHLKQFWDIIRLWGADSAVVLFEVHRICEVKPSLYKKMKEIEGITEPEKIGSGIGGKIAFVVCGIIFIVVIALVKKFL